MTACASPNGGKFDLPSKATNRAPGISAASDWPTANGMAASSLLCNTSVGTDTWGRRSRTSPVSYSDELIRANISPEIDSPSMCAIWSEPSGNSSRVLRSEIVLAAKGQFDRAISWTLAANSRVHTWLTIEYVPHRMSRDTSSGYRTAEAIAAGPLGEAAHTDTGPAPDASMTAAASATIVESDESSTSRCDSPVPRTSNRTTRRPRPSSSLNALYSGISPSSENESRI